MASSSSAFTGPQSASDIHADVDMSKYEKMLSSAVAQCAPELSNLKYPWEMEMYKGIFGDGVEDILKVPPFEPALVPALASEQRIKKPRIEQKVSANLFESVISQSKNETFEEDAAGRIAKVTDKWLTIISVNYDAFEVGNVIAKEYLKVPKFQNSKKILQATFGLKSPATLEKRANAMIRFMIWHKKCKTGFAFPVSREEAWEYVNYLKDSAAGATSASGFLEAVRFCHVLGVRDVEKIFSSKHISGFADQMFANKSVWSPADVLTVQEVILLHEFAECKQFGHVDRLAACHFLHALYSRSRWSDFRHIHEILLDFDENHVGYLEIRTRKHKTAKNADKKSKLLPVVAPTLGIYPRPWSRTWVELRTALGLPTSGVVDGPLFPAPDVTCPEQWTRRPLSANEASKWLQKVFEYIQPGVRRSPTSHSLKSTTLSWCQKYGIDDKDQDVLGRHVQLKSQHVYGRELIAKPLRVYETVLKAVADETFEPDKTRSGYFPPQSRAGVFVTDHVEGKTTSGKEADQDKIDAEKSSESGDSEDSSDQESSSASERGEDKPKKIDAQEKVSDQLFCHVKSRIVHKLFGDAFLCGRPNSAKYVMIDSRRSTYQVLCSKCFKSQHVSVTSANDE